MVNVILLLNNLKVIFFPLALHNFLDYDCHLFSKNLIDIKKDRVKFKIFPETNE